MTTWKKQILVNAKAMQIQKQILPSRVLLRRFLPEEEHRFAGRWCLASDKTLMLLHRFLLQSNLTSSPVENPLVVL